MVLEYVKTGSCKNPIFLICKNHKGAVSVDGVFFYPRKLVFFLFLFSLLMYAGTPHLRGDVSFHTVLGASSSLHLSNSSEYPSKIHPSFGASQSLRFGFGRHAALEPFIGVSSLWASDLSGGFSYRGVTSFSAGLSLELDILSFVPSPVDGEDYLFLGFSLGGKASLAQYEYTELYFFYPSLIFEPLLMFTFPKEPHFFLRLSLPAEGHFRRDLSFAGNLGLKLSAAYAPF